MKKLVFIILILSGLVMIFTPVYMYFSHDVEKLENHYPKYSLKNGEIRYELVEKRPSYWVRFDNISPYLKGAIILSEDWSFYQHNGIDFEQMQDALADVGSAKRLRGASTITQQMVKNVLLSSERSLWRKLHEMILAWKVEKHLSKKRILEIYLNSIEYGKNIYGISKASEFYFSKAPSALSPRESAFLAMLLPSPKVYGVSYRKKKLTPFARKRVNQILQKMRMGRIISPQEYEVAMSDNFFWEEF